MSRQRENPEHQSSLDAIRSLPGATVSGTQLQHFREGWAHAIFGGSNKAHYFVRDTFDAAIALCGLVEAVRLLYGAGNYPYCKRCLAKGDISPSHR